ncbi:hypothetical protein FOZ61_001461 [Perkinsus olseni]|uniref:Uncharacterized protein n=1 Tax=Perkinsus olseni TaxID=32597 RepID=A0A7J6KPR2_PEROL|nr:hypothetical protein FOZ61_001461 [Perkinsus olseni]
MPIVRRFFSAPALRQTGAASIESSFHMVTGVYPAKRIFQDPPHRLTNLLQNLTRRDVRSSICALQRRKSPS